MISAARITKKPKQARIPPLENGDRLTVAEFEHRYEAMPELKKAELIHGIVYIPSSYMGRSEPGIPLLQNGDRLTVAEFERRYEAMKDLKKAELIHGVVYMGSPVRFSAHSAPHHHFNGWVFAYEAFTPGVEAGDNSTVRDLSGESQPQPDVCLRISEQCGGQSKIDEKGYLEGAPEWIGEVSASSATYDLHDKFATYEENGVLEYVVWRVLDKEIDWFILKRGKYQRLAKTKDGLYKSKVFPGLWLDARAMIAGDLAKVLEVVQRGVASREHQRFVKSLRSRKK